ncbi:4Fe-4S dicluster domain-containing protein [Sulfurospirillum sp. 1612]|uniref:4Fe-4S dicluster domain-containing protein n=1 Tax=Sulfurospirillum sp. 1612 TaxID=3094835 RepID=UPI002F92DFD7
MKQDDKKRRDFIKQMTGLGILGLACGAGIYFAPELKASSPILRPPGAVKEEDFLKLCIKCGQCLQVCPYDSIELEDIDGGASVGMAFIDPRKRGCYLCEAFPCMLACPTGALDHEHDNIKYVQMGIAVVADMNACLALTNKPVPNSAVDRIYEHTKVLTAEEQHNKKVVLRGDDKEKVKLQKKVLEDLDKFRDQPCTICASLCPYPTPEDAIGMVKKDGGLLPEIREACVGCGACIELCPTNVLKVIPREDYLSVYKKGQQ